MRNRSFTGFKKLVSLLGADYDIMMRSGSVVQGKFYFSAITILVIFLLSCVSIRYAVNLLFHSLLIELVLSLFLSLLFVCIYILLLHTFAKKQLGKEVPKKSFRASLRNPSNLLRTGFVAFMGFMVSKPIEIYLFEPKLEGDVQEYKGKLLASHQQRVDVLFQTDLGRAEKRKSRLKQMDSDDSPQLKEEIKHWDNKIDSLLLEKNSTVKRASDQIAQSEFFIFQVKTVMVKYKLSWLICLSTVLLFLLPGFLVYSLSEEDDYFQRKNRVEMALVLKDYHSLLTQYTGIFSSRYGKELHIYSIFEDPPFNTKRKAPPACQTQEDFFKKFSS